MAETTRFQPFPPAAVLGFGALIGTALVIATLGRMTGTGVMQEQPSEVVVSRAMVFEDAGAGLVLVRDARDGRVIEELQPGTENFIRGVLRSLARERRAEGAERDAAFVIRLEADGALTIVDPRTDRRINLNAFGPTNRESFARLLQADLVKAGSTAP